MTRIRQRRGRHFIDEEGRLFWINGPDDNCYLSEQRQWRRGLSFDEVLEWKQCAPSGCVSQRFSSPLAACEAFEHAQVVWSHDLYLRRMGDAMACHRADVDYKPTSMRLAEAQGARPRQAPWLLPVPSGPACDWRPGNAPRPCAVAGGHAAPAATDDIPHLHRRRRSAAAAPPR